MDRKKRLRAIQLSLSVLGLAIVIFTYVIDKKENLPQENILTKNIEKTIKKQIKEDQSKNDIFFNIQYKGIEIAGNRYILKSKEAYNDKNNQEIVNMKSINAIFYFKDKTTLKVWSENGEYNNKTLDMFFKDNVKAIYQDSSLFAQKARYSNAKGFLTISEKVKVLDERGTLYADKLLFDIKNQKLNISALNDKNINTNINLK